MVAGYQYTALSDLDGCVGADRNVYGIIVDGVSAPVKSKGSGTYEPSHPTQQHTRLEHPTKPPIVPSTELAAFARSRTSLRAIQKALIDQRRTQLGAALSDTHV